MPDGRRLAFVAARHAQPAHAYEAGIAQHATIPLRQRDWHDAFNAFAWLAMPRTKAALNAIHVRDALVASGNRRTRARDAATLLDESGVVVATDDVLVDRLLRAHAWRELFVTHAALVAERVRVVVLGHGLLDRLRHPYRALTAKALVVRYEGADNATIDALAAAAVAGPGFGPRSLTPLPVAALPGWDTEQLGAALFDDISVFRAKVLRSPAS